MFVVLARRWGGAFVGTRAINQRAARRTNITNSDGVFALGLRARDDDGFTGSDRGASDVRRLLWGAVQRDSRTRTTRGRVANNTGTLCHQPARRCVRGVGRSPSSGAPAVTAVDGPLGAGLFSLLLL